MNKSRTRGYEDLVCFWSNNLTKCSEASNPEYLDPSVEEMQEGLL
jgi:hypothetical protein